MKGTLVLDSAGLAGYLENDRKVMLLVDAAKRQDRALVISAATIIEAQHGGVRPARMNRVLSRLRVEDLTRDAARAAAALLEEAGLHGHRCAIDAMVAEAALRQRPPVTLLTSDVGDLSRLCGSAVRVIGI
ncbi:hypothetical protein [Nocardiopsis potens]|uniref:hypothetical protein n=1 Tax=Nocardiopsis potens TaxID=1246458 RepID=UPI000349579F|nr:hypothetical protein [Nocardiopsis potens]